MILLETLLEGLNVEVTPFAICEFRGDGHFDLSRNDHATLHVVLAGAGTLAAPNWAAIDLTATSLVVLPPRTRHSWCAAAFDGTISNCGPLEGNWQRITEGAGDAGILLCCATLVATYRQGAGLFDYLDAPIVERLRKDDPLRQALDQLLAELGKPQPGTHDLARALIRQCLILLLRQHCESGECQLPWLTALEDERLGKAVKAMLDNPAGNHSVQSLGDLAGMSRSSFARHFTASFGRGPMDFLKEIRLRRAAGMLSARPYSVKTVAGRVGYASRSYFSRVFKEMFGVSPDEFNSIDVPTNLDVTD